MSTQALRRFAALPALILMTALAGACDDDITDPDDDLVGEFGATEAVFTSVDDPTVTFDVIAADGTLDFDFREDGTFESRLEIPDRDPLIRTGTFEVQDDDTLLLTEDGVTREVEFERPAGALRLRDPGTFFDFGTGPIPADLDATFADLT